MFFYAFDGDNVGRHLECLILSNDCDAISSYSELVRTAIDDIVEELKRFCCKIIFQGGDSILACSETEISSSDLPIKRNGLTFSIGVGKTPTRALLALKKAKGSGKGRVEVFNGEII